MNDYAWHLAAPTERLMFVEDDGSGDLVSDLKHLHICSAIELRTLVLTHWEPLGRRFCTGDYRHHTSL